MTITARLVNIIEHPAGGARVGFDSGLRTLLISKPDGTGSGPLATGGPEPVQR